MQRLISRYEKNIQPVWLLLMVLVSVALLAACGGPAADDSVSEGSTGSQSGVAGVKSGVLGGNPCNAFSMLGGAGFGGGFIGQAMGGPDVETSGSPGSDFAREVGEFAEESLEEVFNGDVSTDCFLEVKMAGEGGLWVSLTLPGPPPSGAGQALGEAMTKRGATIEGAFSSSVAGASFDLVGVKDLPIESPSGGDLSGGLYFVTDDDGVSFAVMIVAYDQSNAGQDPASGAGEPPPIAPTAVVVAVTPSGTAKLVDSEFRPALQQAFDVDLIVESFFEVTVGAGTSVTVAYVIDGDASAVSDPLASLTKVIEGLGGTVSFSFAGGDTATVTFEGLQVSGLTAGGTLTLLENQFAVTLVELK